MNNETVKQIPYGVANYDRLVEKNCYYVDKTRYFHDVEKAGDYLFFIRPRRFGKSLFLSILEAYYDIVLKDRFDELFNGTYIHDNPTAERGQYLVLSFNFSGIDAGTGKLKASFLHHIRSRALLFLGKYDSLLTKNRDYFEKIIHESTSGSDILSAVISLCEASGQKIYIIIDEYDNFANTILSQAGQEKYKELTRHEGFFRSFFKVLKAGTTSMGAPITRLYITGVSPITMDDVTSGFNIGENISLDAAFNCMMGFDHREVCDMLDYYRSAGMIQEDNHSLMQLISQWYGNYRFSQHSPPDRQLYNPDMILHFLKEYFKNHHIPKDLIDHNVRIDYGKLKHLIIIDKGMKKTINGNFSRLLEIMQHMGTSSILNKGFPLDELESPTNFTSLLFYFGLLAIDGPDMEKVRFRIPNETVKRLYYDYIQSAYKDTHIFKLDDSEYRDLISDAAFQGHWEPLFGFLTTRMQESISLRDLMSGEKAVQTFLSVYLGISGLYIVHTEKEMNKGFADIVMEPSLARYKEIKYAYLLELKYVKAGDKPDKTTIEVLKKEAEAQLDKYSLDTKFRKTIGNTGLIKLVLIFAGHELVYMGRKK